MAATTSRAAASAWNPPTLARSIQDTPHDNEIEFVQEGVDFSPDISDPENVQANPAPGTMAGTYLFNNFEPESSYASNLDHVAALNLTLPYNLGRSASGKLKFGAKYRDKHKWQDFVSVESELADGADDIVLGEDVGVPFEVDNYEAGDYEFLHSPRLRMRSRPSAPISNPHWRPRRTSRSRPWTIRWTKRSSLRT